MALDKAYNRVDLTAVWEVLKIHGVVRKLLEAVIVSYNNTRANVAKMNGEIS